MFKYELTFHYNMPKENISLKIPEKLYPDIELPKWMTSKEKAVILFDDI